jgi:hypothetical protein
MIQVRKKRLRRALREFPMGNETLDVEKVIDKACGRRETIKN